MPKRKTFIIIGIIITVIFLVFSILSNSNISITTSADNSELVLGAKFPNANCKKVFKRDFPFFEFKCTPISDEPAIEGDKTTDVPTSTVNEAKDDSKTSKDAQKQLKKP